MPRQRQRIVYCDCFDCRDRPEDHSLTPEQLNAATAVARQEPPPKALLLYVTGFVCAVDGASSLESCTLPHCNLVVREGNLGLLSVRQAEEAAGAGLEPAVAELAQLLGVYQDTIRQPPSGSGSEAAWPRPGLPTLAARFKGMQAALGSTSAAARQLAQQVGMAVVNRLCIGADGAGTGVAEAGMDGSGACSAATAARTPAAATEPATTAATTEAAAAAGSAGVGGNAGDGDDGGALAAEQRPLAGVLPDANTFAGLMAAELGAAEGATGRDLLLLHLDLDDLRVAAAAGPANGERRAEASEAEAEAEARWDARSEALEWLDSLVRGLLALPEVRERTLLVLMLSPGGQKLPAVPGQGAAAGGGLLQPGGAKIDPAAAVVTPRNAALVGRGGGGGAAAAAVVTASAAVGMAGAGGALSVLDSEELPLISRPVQSFETLGMGRVEVDVSTPVLVARRLPGVIRRDRAERLGYREALTAGGQGAILIDRLLHEVAYKIGRAPKYGA